MFLFTLNIFSIAVNILVAAFLYKINENLSYAFLVYIYGNVISRLLFDFHRISQKKNYNYKVLDQDELREFLRDLKDGSENDNNE